MAQTLLPDPEALHLEKIIAEDGTITFFVSTRQPTAPCPACGCFTARVHSRYQRTVMDLPWQGIAVKFRLTCRKFFCDNMECARRIFTEPLPLVVKRYARKTVRLTDALRELAFLAGGEAAARIARAFGLLVSPDALLESLHKVPFSPPCSTPKVLGIDDFAFRKGRRYGTILVDLEKKRPVDLLPDRDAKTVEQWLKEHPGVQIVSRDRAEVYRNGITAGAPNAVQVADRFHLLANLQQALHDSLIPFKSHFRRSYVTDTSPSARGPCHRPQGSGLTTQQQKLQAQRRQKRYDLWEKVRALREKGYTQAEIAAEVAISVRTVVRLVKPQVYPERKARTRSVNSLTSFLPYIEEQWNGGQCCAARLYRAVQEQGFTGSYGAVYGAVCRLKKGMALYPAAACRAVVPARSSHYSVRQMTWLLLRSVDEETLSWEEAADVRAALASDASLPALRDFAHAFLRLIRNRDVQDLSDWLGAAQNSSFGAMKRFAVGLAGDVGAVRASLENEWSNGQVEGQVNRLKFIKRSMYGRGSFELLRTRVLHRAAA